MIMIDLLLSKTSWLLKLQRKAKLPMKQTQGAACFDMYACCDDPLITLEPGERALIPTGLIFDIPEGHSAEFTHDLRMGGYQRHWSFRITRNH